MTVRESTMSAGSLGCQPNAVLGLNGVPNQPTGPLEKSHFVGKAALEKHPDAEMSGNVGHRNQRHVLCDAKVDQVVGLDQDEQGLRLRVLDFGEFAAEILDEDLLQPSCRRNGFFLNELEAA